MTMAQWKLTFGNNESVKAFGRPQQTIDGEYNAILGNFTSYFKMILYFNLCILIVQGDFGRSMLIFGFKFDFEYLVQIFKFRVFFIRGKLFNFRQFEVKSKLYHIDQPSQMSKEKKIRKIVLEKLYHQNQLQTNHLKKSTRSNAPTQSTPNQPKTSSKMIEKFFQHFQAECAIIYEPVLLDHRKSLKRSLQNELFHLYKNDRFLKFKEQQGNTFESSKENCYHPLPIEYATYSKSIRGRENSISKNSCQFKQQKPKQKRRINTDIGNASIIKNKSTVYAAISPQSSVILSKQNSNQRLFYNSKLPSPSSKIENSGVPKPISIQKQYDKNLKTNSRALISKHLNNNGMNAPKKIPANQCGMDRVKRIQSLKNLNQNGIRKYIYRRES